MEKACETVQYRISFPGRVYAGAGSSERLGDILEETGSRRVCVLTDPGISQSGVLDKILSVLEQWEAVCEVIDDVPAEPDVEALRRICLRASGNSPRLFIGVGGGSVMDVTKVAAAANTNPDYLENIRDVGRLKEKGTAAVMIPTTAGTGAEVTPNAIFYFPEEEMKEGLVSDRFLPDYCILDPTLTISLPPSLTASTGIDALCHGVEAYLSKLNNPVCEMLALEAVSLITGNLERCYLNGGDLEARERMQLGAFYAGLCLCTSSTVAVHALSYPLGGRYRIPHGVANAMLLPYVMEANLECCREKFARLAKITIADWENRKEENLPELFVEYLAGLTCRLGIPSRLSDFHVGREELESLVNGALTVQRLLSRNPRVLSAQDIRSIYNRLL